ncbi:MAG: TRAP transporter substrate-binding protein DctP [Burkholderiales bacterium]|nr:TRAP transporter substrate-binding protein DctP [Burkholderiales bacterium]
MKTHLASFAVAAVAAAAIPSASAQTTLLFNRYVPPTHVISTSIVGAWAQEVEKVTEGRVKFNYPADSLSPPPGQWELVTQGLADGAFIQTAFAVKRLPLTQLADLPFAAWSVEATAVALWRTHERFFSKADEHKGVAFMGYFSAPGGNMFSLTDKPITAVGDLKNLKMWSLPNLPAQLLGKLGASVVPGPATRIHEVVSKGVVDAHASLGFHTILAFNAMPYTKSATEIPGRMNASSFSVFLNLDKWNAISQKDRAAILSVSGEKLARQSRAWDLVEEDSRKKFIDSGKRVQQASPEFMAALQKAWAFAEEEWIAEAGKKGVDGKAALAYFREQAKAVANERR